MSRNLVFIVRIEKLNSTDEIMEIMKRKSYFLLGKFVYCFLEPPGYFLKKEVSIQFRGIFVFVFYSDPLHEFSHTFVHDQVQNHIHQALAKTLAGHRRACDIHLCPVILEICRLF